MPKQPTQQVGRLAMRQEGGNWNAYYALPDSMDKALFLGSIRMRLIMGKPELKRTFMDLMRECVADLIEQQTGVRPSWGGTVVAPESERAGHS